MPDEFDLATEQRDDLLANQIETARRQGLAGRCLPVGKCYNCNEPVPLPKLYCDRECADMHHHRTERERYAQIITG